MMWIKNGKIYSGGGICVGNMWYSNPIEAGARIR